LEHAVETEPDYALAWAMLTVFYGTAVANGFGGSPDLLDRALVAGERAVELDPNSQRVRVYKATAHFFRKEMDLFEAEAERALAINPNNAETLGTLGFFLSHAGHYDRGIPMIEKAISLNPFHPNWYKDPIIWNHYLNGGYEQALEVAQQTESAGNFWSFVFQAMAHAELDNRDAAGRAAEKVLAIFPEFPGYSRGMCRTWLPNREDDCEKFIASLRKAGLDIPDEPAAGD
jgi:tetratricopeptide (TPR) repeat protein